MEIINDRIFTTELLKLRIESNKLRSESHDHIINWVDNSPFKNSKGTIVPGKSLTFVLPTKGCKYAMAKHGGCSMCTLPMDNPLNPSSQVIDSLPERTLEIFNKKGGVEEFKGVKFYTSGSFLDRWELNEDVRKNILRKFVDIVDEITIETRCEFVNSKNLDDILKVVPAKKLIVAIGQETTDDEINRRSVNKGHKYLQFKRAVNILKSYGIRIKGYILLKSIFMSELSSIDDALRTAKHMYDLKVDYISINPCYIGKKTLMEQLFKQKTYRSPWLWSVYYTTVSIKKLVQSETIVICDPVAAGSERGPRNCGICDKEVKQQLKEFSSTQDLDNLIGLECECYDVYSSVLNTEHLSNGMGMTNIYE